MRVCCLALVGALGVVSASTLAQDAAVETPNDLERPGAFELVPESPPVRLEDGQIFTPLSPVIVEPEPVKLPQDQSLES